MIFSFACFKACRKSALHSSEDCTSEHPLSNVLKTFSNWEHCGHDSSCAWSQVPSKSASLGSLDNGQERVKSQLNAPRRQENKKGLLSKL